MLGKAHLMGAWDYFYPNSAFSASVSTHYGNLPHWLPLSWDEVARFKLPTGAQHSAWQWLPLADAAQNLMLYAYVRPYAVCAASKAKSSTPLISP